ncbi:hypothetical protein NDN08_003468 [Rhodosorus marinus]|uniref:Letm1 RBD domain-containing protein n=1 Tax=Rhodosorus marinus TaxID=101924 RepID=A0AAV8UX99_9RHOD|nr:hypothetical protein NDN08_003468 [Rhodosorus marinus]
MAHKPLRIILTPVVRSIPSTLDATPQAFWAMHACGSRPRFTKDEQSFISRQFNKLTDLVNREWDKSSTAPARSMRGLVYKYGQRVLSRIPNEEYLFRDLNALEIKAPTLLYPSSLVEGEVKQFVQTLAIERRSLHQRMIHGSVAALPFTMLFSIVPILPNIPFAYNCMRLYHHITALSGARKLVDLLDTDRLNYAKSIEIQEVLDSMNHVKVDGFSFMDRETRDELGKVLDAPDLSKTLQRAVRQLEVRFGVHRKSRSRSGDEVAGEGTDLKR